jgi:uncharacterized short protein YbdD (DUF466 family)
MTTIARAVRILLSVLREIFDESAYARFLDRTHLASSPAAYAAFFRERQSGKERSTRCC